ncbi:hypothetical protein CDL12_01079 [Handroanthus impetiginosus]|uniref:J domain-containing protein n=1 Tax=Handroanthus impetiginosus TaxID=429701 RepID=A0A2G9I8U0_9LAMI|nr:hypothetical protein CDL12_01079 [Handroanthus impetiginosus]
MAAQIISRADQITLNLSFKPNYSRKAPLPNNISNISFSSQVTKSRISLKTPSGSCITRSTTWLKVLPAPIESDETLYEVLKITDPENATALDIKKAYKRMKKKYHPKVAPRNKVGKYTKWFMRVHEAYLTLSDPEKRALYDKDFAEIERQREWKMRCRAQLDKLKLRTRDPNSWAAMMRSVSSFT